MLSLPHWRNHTTANHHVCTCRELKVSMKEAIGTLVGVWTDDAVALAQELVCLCKGLYIAHFLSNGATTQKP